MKAIVKKYRMRPDDWNNEGLMDKYMGKEIDVTGDGREFNQMNVHRSWTYKEYQLLFPRSDGTYDMSNLCDCEERSCNSCTVGKA